MAPAGQQDRPLGMVVRARSLRTNFTWTFASNILYAGCQWGMLIVLAKLGSPALVGQFTLGLAVTAPVMLFTNLQLRYVQVTDVVGEYRFGDYLGLRLAMSTLALLVIVGLVLASGYGGNMMAIILFVGLAKIFESISDVFHALLQRNERMELIARSVIIRGLLSLAAISASVAITGGVLWGAIGMAVGWGVILLVYDIPNGARVLTALATPGREETSRWHLGPLVIPRPHWVPATQRRLAWLALPMGVVMALVSLNVNIPRYFIERTLGTTDLGIFAALVYLMVTGNTLVDALGGVSSPRLARYYATGDRSAYRSLLLRLLVIGALLGGGGVVVAALAGRPILLLIYRPEYADHADLFVWVMVAAGLSYAVSFIGYGMTAARYFRVQVPLFLLVSAVTIGACLLLIPTYRLLGAVLVVVIGKTVELVGSAVIVVYAIRQQRLAPLAPIEGGESGCR